MNDNQILVLHSRWVYNFMGIILEAQVSFAFMHSFQKLVSDFGDFQTLYVRRDGHRESTTCKWVFEMNRGIHCKSGSSFMGLTVNAGISIWNEECSWSIFWERAFSTSNGKESCFATKSAGFVALCTMPLAQLWMTLSASMVFIYQQPLGRSAGLPRHCVNGGIHSYKAVIIRGRVSPQVDLFASSSNQQGRLHFYQSFLIYRRNLPEKTLVHVLKCFMQRAPGVSTIPSSIKGVKVCL